MTNPPNINLEAPVRRAVILFVTVVAVLALMLWLLWKADTGIVKEQKGKIASPAATPPMAAPSAPQLYRRVVLPDASATPSHPPGENAADLYKNAFALFNELSDDEKSMLAHPRDEVDADKAEALFKKIQPIMELLRRAKTDATYCDWGIGPVRFDKPLPQMNAVMKLGQLARWDAAYLFPDDPEGAVADLAAHAQLGRSVGGEEMIGYLVDVALNAGAIDLIRNNAAMLTPEALSQAMEMLHSSGAAEDFSHALTEESEAMRSIADALANPETREKTLKSMMGMMSGDALPQSMFKTSAEDIAAQVEWIAQMEKDFGQKALLPDAEFNAWWSQVSGRAESRPYAKVILPTMNTFRDRYRVNTVNQSMLSAGLTILQNGPEARAVVTDPTTGRAFTYIPSPTGFTLRSTFRYKDKPVTMFFPAAAP